MTFRDADQATRAQNDALEQENQELREQLADAKALLQKRDSEQLDRNKANPVPWVTAGIITAAGGAFLCLRFGMPIIALPVFVVAGVGLAVFGATKRLIVLVPPNELLVVFGRTHFYPDGEKRGYRIVREGRTVVYPVVERPMRMSLQPVSIEGAIHGAYSRDGRPLSVSFGATVRIAVDTPDVHNAIERFVGHSTTEIGRVAQETIEGSMRGLTALITADELQHDRYAFAQQVIEDTELDAGKLGLSIELLTITDVAPT